MMRGAAPSKATVPQKPVVQEAPVKFRSGKHTAIVKEVFDITTKYPETYLIRFTFENETVFDFEPGQFISIFAEKEGKRISRPYSIAAWPENKAFPGLCIKVGEGGFMSNFLHHVPVGTKLPTIGPLGRFVMQEPIPFDTVFVATGTGVAPFIAMMGHIWDRGLDRGREFHMVFGVRYVQDLIYRDLIEKWEREHRNFHFYPTISRPETSDWKGRVGYVQKILENEIKDTGGNRCSSAGSTTWSRTSTTSASASASRTSGSRNGTEPAHGLRRNHTFPTIRSRGTAPKERLSRLTAALSPSKGICVEASVSDTRFTRKRSESSGSRTTTRSPRRGRRTR